MNRKSLYNSDEDLIRRAIVAYYRFTDSVDQPSLERSELVEIDELIYVVLRNVSSLLAVYRFRNNGQLKKLKNWPEEII